MDKAKPFDIPKREVWEAFKKVKANQGAAGVDGQSVADFEADLANNLYKLWNRMSSGSYMPPPVRRVDIPKGDSKTETRPLGIPTVADRIAQEVVKRYLEPILEPIFHEDSYGYRPGLSAIDAVRKARQRCWRYDWVLDVDVRSYLDRASYYPLTHEDGSNSVGRGSTTLLLKPLRRPCRLPHRASPLHRLPSPRRSKTPCSSSESRLRRSAQARRRATSLQSSASMSQG